jgi:hypothetical protein
VRKLPWQPIPYSLQHHRAAAIGDAIDALYCAPSGAGRSVRNAQPVASLSSS